MLDRRFIIENVELVQENCNIRGVKADVARFAVLENQRRALQQEVEDIHELFKAQIREHRPQVDVERVATGEHWHGIRALELKLVDELKTSDDLLLEAVKDRDLYHLSFKRRRGWQERLFGGAESLLLR